MDDIAVGLIGYGVGGAMFHAPFLAAVPRLRLAAIATGRQDQVRRDFADVRIYSTPDRLIADSGLDLVVISTPTATHAALAESALLAGKHVVVDKPFALAAAEASRLIELARSEKRFLSVYQNRRWDGDFRTVRRVIEKGRLGAVYSFESHIDRFRTEIKPGWREQPGAGSGILYDLGAHLIDQAIVLFGMPSAITADVMAQRPAARATDYFHLILDYGRLRVILHSSLLVREAGPRFAVHGDGGSFLKYGVDPQEGALNAGRRPGAPDWGRDHPEQYGLLVAADGTASQVETLPGAYQSYYEAVAAAILDGGPVPVDPADSRKGLELIELAMRSAAERRTVEVAGAKTAGR